MRFAGFLLFVAGLMTMPVAHAAEARPAERLVKNDQQGVVYAIPKDSPFKVEKKSIDGVYFAGQVQLTGKYVYGRNNPADEVGIAYPKPDLYFMPDDQSRWLLPYLKERGAVAGFYFRNADAFLKAVVAPDLAAQVRAEKIRSISGDVTIVIESFYATVECDTAMYSANFVRAVTDPQVMAQKSYAETISCG